MLTLLVILLLVLLTPYLIYFALFARTDFTKSPAHKNPAHQPGISIVIPTYNEESIVAKKLDNIFKQNYPLNLLEIIFVDSSTDSTREIISEYQKKYPCIRIIEEKERRGLATALNEGYSAGRGEIIVKTDCDSFLDENALSNAAANFADPTVGAVSGKQVVINESLVEEGYRSLQFKVQMLESCIDSTIIFHGPFSAFKKELLVPIDTDSLADDSELAVKIRKQGYRTIIDPEIKFYEASQSQFFKRRLQKDRRGTGLIRLLIRQRDVLFNPAYGKYGSIIFPMNYFMMILSPYLLLTILLLTFYLLLANNILAGISAMLGFLVFVYLGQANRLGPLEALYSFTDTQISLLLGGLALLHKKDGTWEVDKELREAYLRE